MAKVEFSDFISQYPVYGTQCRLSGTNTEISLPEKGGSFFIEPTFEVLSEDNDPGSFVVITAPGATGKSALSTYICRKQNAFYWNLSKSIIGDNYFIGTISKAFGPTSLPKVLDDLRTGQIGFVIDAFDEAEISCGWTRIQGFIEEIQEYTKDSPRHTITLVARQETAAYLRMLLEDSAGSEGCCYRINFFARENARKFLVESLKKDDGFLQHQNRMLEVFDLIASGVDKVLSGQREEQDYAFYGYAPVLQAIAVLFKETSNYQELERDFRGSDFSKLTNTIITNILSREQKKFIDVFTAKSDEIRTNKTLIDKLYSIDEQLYYLAQYMNHCRLDVTERVKDYDMSGSLISEYQKSVDSFVIQHPFVLDQASFASPVFHDYCYAYLLARHETKDIVLSAIRKELPQITRLFWDFYIAENSGKIEGEHIGILYSSLVSQLQDGETFASICGRNGNFIFSSPLLSDRSSSLPEEISVTARESLVFPNHLRNIFIDIDRNVVLTSGNEEYSLYNVEIHTTGKIMFQGNHLEVICENDKPVLLSSDQPFDFSSYGLEIKKEGNGDFITSFPGGKIYPFADYYRDIAAIEEKNTDNAFLALRQILRWFRRDRRDSIARFAALIDQIVRSNKLAQEMLQYLLNSRILWKDGAFYKMTAKEAERKGINFSALQSADGKEKLKTFLDGFVQGSK